MSYALGSYISVCLLTLSVGASAADLIQQRNDFLVAEKLIAQKNNDAYSEVSATLTDYPLYPLLQYQWLKNNLPETEKILSFLVTYKDSRYAELLRAKWLGFLAAQERWPELLQNYQATDDVALQCQYYWAMYKAGNSQQALTEAKQIWLSGSFQPNECEPLLTLFTFSPAINSDLIWQRFDLALQQNNLALAEYVRRLMARPEQMLADLWLGVHKQPGLIESNVTWQHNDPLVGRIFAHGVTRMMGPNLEQAVFLWDRDKSSFKLDNNLLQQVERKLALALAFKRHYSAYGRLSKLTVQDEETREWRVRAALLEQDWTHVGEALAGLTAEEQQTPHWQYWLARSLAKAGDSVQSQAVYNKLSEDRSFYGFMAAELLSKPYQIVNKPVPLLGNELLALEALPDFQVAGELNVLGRTLEARRQWAYATKKLSKPQLMVAAKLAQKWHWDQLAIFTLAKSDYWDDIELRFPINYIGQVEGNAYKQNLDPALILGLIRQESVFDKDVQSAVGAKGLMQIMPKTGQQIAKDLGEVWQSDNNLFDSETNVRYGAFYFKQLLNRFNGNFALATAAYNAGPHNVKKWLPPNGVIPSDIWIETIPFKETRKYVASVLAYALVYQQRMRRDVLRVKYLLPDVQSG